MKVIWLRLKCRNVLQTKRYFISCTVHSHFDQRCPILKLTRQNRNCVLQYWACPEWRWCLLDEFSVTHGLQRGASCYCEASGRTWQFVQLNVRACCPRSDFFCRFCCGLQTWARVLVLLAAFKDHSCHCHPQRLQDAMLCWWDLEWNVVKIHQPLVEKKKRKKNADSR